jgi:hypothetical protein
VTGKRDSRRKQLLVDLKERRRYWKLKEETLVRAVWRNRFGIGSGSAVRLATECMIQLLEVLPAVLHYTASYTANTSSTLCRSLFHFIKR